MFNVMITLKYQVILCHFLIDKYDTRYILEGILACFLGGGGGSPNRCSLKFLEVKCNATNIKSWTKIKTRVCACSSSFFCLLIFAGIFKNLIVIMSVDVVIAIYLELCALSNLGVNSDLSCDRSRDMPEILRKCVPRYADI